MKFSEKDMVQRKHNYAIVDEIDSCLIDEARTPLVISGATEDKTSQYIAIDKLVKNLNNNDFEVDEKDKNILDGTTQGTSSLCTISRTSWKYVTRRRRSTTGCPRAK